ncbi:MAG: hypothetical protein ACE5JG_08440 [Planctomycetota bacterium]
MTPAQIQDLLLYGVGLPAAFAAAAYLLLRPRGTGDDSRGAAFLALGGGFALGHVLLPDAGWPRFPPDLSMESTHWLVYFGAAFALLGLLGRAGLLTGRDAAGPAALLLLGAPALLLLSRVRHEWTTTEAVVRLAAFGAMSLALWGLCHDLARRLPRWSTSLLLLGVTAAGAGALGLTGSISLAQLAAVPLAVLVVVCLPWVRGREHPFDPALLPVTVLVWAGLWLNGVYYSEMPAPCGLLLSAAPLAAWLGFRLASLLLGRTPAALFGLLLAAAAAAAAVWVAYQASPPFDPSSPY